MPEERNFLCEQPLRPLSTITHQSPLNPQQLPTLIRWKEGLTARPRYREDVLRCAEVLRLTPEEWDELLQAADFEPEAPPAEVPPPEPAPDPTPVSPAESDAPPVPARRRRRLRIAV